jgi:hypothetical protein
MLIAAHPEKMICDDPRMVEGGMLMHNYVVSNQYTEGLSFKASASEYVAGSSLELTVTANGSRFVSDAAPMGVFLVIQSRSACTLVGDNGAFSGLSKDMDATSGCSSSVFSKTAGGGFKGNSSAVWTAGPGTVGDVTFTLLWSNGPGGTDPLSVKGFVRVPDSYMYMKTITISGPSGPCPPSPSPPAPVPGSSEHCVVPSGEGTGVGCSLEGVGAPVFIQNLGVDGEATFPSGRCLPCRIDYRKQCRSARVTCPTEPGGSLEEHIWVTSDDCQGKPSRIGYLSSDVARCPAPEHYSVDLLDLERFVPKLQRDHGHHILDEAMARLAVEEYRKMLKLIQKFPDQPVVPSKLVDLAWHEHILDTARYKRDCLRLFGRYIHHNPSFGGEEEKAELTAQQLEMFRSYREAFNEEPPMAVWPTQSMTRLGMGGALPDCCSAQCVKPECHSCVGCNSVFCGFLAADGETTPQATAGKAAAKRTLSPDAVAGYVPATSPAANPPPPEAYRCSFSVNMPSTSPYKMSMEWSICGERAFFKQSLAGVSAWYALGLAGKGQSDMGFGDYMLSMMSRNYTGVKDLYKYDAGNGYPCWDVLHECSVGNRTKGTKDVENDSIQRVNGVTTSTWSRRLAPTDYKDMPISRGSTDVLLAHGTEDHFTFHQEHSVSCKVDFFSGKTSCGPNLAEGRAVVESVI